MSAWLCAGQWSDDVQILGFGLGAEVCEDWMVRGRGKARSVRSTEQAVASREFLAGWEGAPNMMPSPDARPSHP